MNKQKSHQYVLISFNLFRKKRKQKQIRLFVFFTLFTGTLQDGLEITVGFNC